MLASLLALSNNAQSNHCDDDSDDVQVANDDAGDDDPRLGKPIMTMVNVDLPVGNGTTRTRWCC
jgi:hypothetical protein